MMGLFRPITTSLSPQKNYGSPRNDIKSKFSKIE